MGHASNDIYNLGTNIDSIRTTGNPNNNKRKRALKLSGEETISDSDQDDDQLSQDISNTPPNKVGRCTALPESDEEITEVAGPSPKPSALTSNRKPRF